MWTTLVLQDKEQRVPVMVCQVLDSTSLRADLHVRRDGPVEIVMASQLARLYNVFVLSGFTLDSLRDCLASRSIMFGLPIEIALAGNKSSSRLGFKVEALEVGLGRYCVTIFIGGIEKVNKGRPNKLPQGLLRVF